MGIRFNKIRLDQYPTICPPVIVNPSEAGSIYFVQHARKTEPRDNESEQTENQAGKTSHFALTVDITGSSTTDQFISTHFDLNVNDKDDYRTYIESKVKIRSWDHYFMVRKIGQIPLDEITAFDTPFLCAKHLEHRLLFNVYVPMSKFNNGPDWSSTLNCKTFTRSAIEYLGFQFPSDVQIISDCIPTMFNLY